MANREISIILRAKNAMAAGLSRAKASVQAFGRSALNIGTFFAKAFLGAGAAVAGFAAKAISAYSESEKAERSLVAAINAHGEAGDVLLPSLKKIAAAIQDETGAADESTLAGMAKLRMLGVQTSQMEEAAKAVIALKSVGLEEAAAQKAVAMALQGNYDMLNRYVPALRAATSDTKKAQIVNELFARGYEQQKELLNTVAGRWGALKGRVGDLWEEFGRGISESGEITGALAKIDEAVKAFTERLSMWIDSGGVQNFMAIFKQMAADWEHGFAVMKNNIDKFFSGLTGQSEAIAKERERIDKEYAERSRQIAEETAKNIADAAERRKKKAEELGNAEREEIEKTTQTEKDAASARKMAMEEVAKMRVKELLDKRAKGKEEGKAAKEETEKARRLEDRLSRNVRLGKKDADWLKAYKDIKAAQRGVMSTGVHESYALAQESLTVERSMADDLHGIRSQINQAITY